MKHPQPHPIPETRPRVHRRVGTGVYTSALTPSHRLRKVTRIRKCRVALCRVLVTLATCLSRRDKQTENAPAKNKTGALVFIILIAPDQKEDKQHREQFGTITEEKLDWTEIAHLSSEIAHRKQSLTNGAVR